MAIEINSCKKKYSTKWTHPRDIVIIGWKSPLERWIKLNCDGAHKESANLGACYETQMTDI
jgi:hypothetical protein